MTRDELRQQVQDRAIAEFLKTNHKATLEMGTGVGKTLTALRICQSLALIPEPTSPNLILVPSEDLRDVSWIDDMKKFGFRSDLFQIECYQTAYRWRDKAFWAVIADEFDFSLTEKYSQFYLHNTYQVLIGLTATIPDDKRELANRIAPTCFKYTTQDAQRDGILNKTKFFQVNFDIGHVRNIEVKHKGGRFMQSENGMYLYLQESFTEPLYGLKPAEAELNTAMLMDCPQEEIDKLEKKLKNLEGRMKMFSRKRKEFLHTLTSSRKVTQLLVNTIHKEPGHKILIFSKLTEQIDLITEHTHHAKNKKEGEENKIFQLNAGIIKTLGACETINRGTNLVGVDTIIEESYVGSSVDFQQKHGRGTRLEIDEIMYFFILVPHYWARVQVIDPNDLTKFLWQWVRQPTQAMTWYKNMTEKFNISDIEIIEIVHNQRDDTYSLPVKYDRLCQSS